jgi:hypothetical protein
MMPLSAADTLGMWRAPRSIGGVPTNPPMWFTRA